jgi:uncharacterized protein YhjY with autotransporter beta-barrel domain
MHRRCVRFQKRWLNCFVALCLGVLAQQASAQLQLGGGFQGGGFQGGFGGGFQGGFQGFQFGGFQGGFQGGFGQFGNAQTGGFQLGGLQTGGTFQGGFQGGISQFGGGQFGGQTGGGFNFGSQGFAAFSSSVNGQQGFTILASRSALGSGSGSGADGQIRVLAIDSAAIASCIISGVPVALSQRELLLHSTRASTGDVNGRLFRLRARAASDPPSVPAPVISGKKAAKSVQPVEIQTDDGLLTVFAGANYAAADLDWRGVSSGFQSDTWTGTIGAELRLTEHLVLGLAGTYLNTEGDFDTRGSVDAEGFAVAAYLSYTHGGFYADTLYSYGNFEEDIHRRTGLGTTARAEPTSENHSVEFNTGYNFHVGALTTGPILGLDYRNGSLDGYDEHGDSRASLRYEQQNYDSLISRAGWQASYRIETGFGAITPQVRAAWEHEFLNENEFIKVSLVNSPYRWLAGGSSRPNYSVSARTTSPDEDYLNVGGGVLIEFGPEFSIILNYEGHVFRSDSVEHFASIVMSLEF